MTDLSPRDLDQLASDLVDGLLPPAEAERARRDPEIAARAARIEQVRSALRAVPRPTARHVDSVVAAALAAARGQADTDPRRPPLHAVGSSGRAAPPPPARRTTRPWLAAAAAILLAGLVTAGLIKSGSNGDDDDSAAVSAADEKSGEETVDSDSMAEPGAGSTYDDNRNSDEGDSDTTADGGEVLSAGGSVDQLGAADDEAALADLVAQRIGRFTPESGPQVVDGADPSAPVSSTSAPSPTSQGGAALEPCPGLSDAGDPAKGSLVYVADATYRDAAVRVHLYETDGESRLVATDQACVDVVDVPFDA
jgi:hypothetical protein